MTIRGEGAGPHFSLNLTFAAFQFARTHSMGAAVSRGRVGESARLCAGLPHAQLNSVARLRAKAGIFRAYTAGSKSDGVARGLWIHTSDMAQFAQRPDGIDAGSASGLSRGSAPIQ